jgi:hypothetical protein
MNYLPEPCGPQNAKFENPTNSIPNSFRALLIISSRVTLLGGRGGRCALFFSFSTKYTLATVKMVVATGTAIFTAIAAISSQLKKKIFEHILELVNVDC